MKNKKEKGQYGYRTYHKKIQLLKVAFGAVMILVQLGARNLTDNDAAKNVLTIMAILSVLPTANVASPLLAAWKYRTPSLDFYQRVSKMESAGVILYDLIITSKEQIIPADAVMVHPQGVFVYCTSGKADGKKAEKYLNTMFTSHRLDPNAKVIKDETAFLKRLESLKPSSEYEDDGSVDYAVNLLKNLSM